MTRPTPNHVHKATITEWHDGDTVKLDLDLDYETHNRGWHRLIGINAPELVTPEGKAALAYVESLAPVGSEVVIVSYKNPNQIPVGGVQEKYGRWLAEVWLVGGAGDGLSINRTMVAMGQAVDYSGGVRV